MVFKIEFLGCKVNSYEVEAVANALKKAGFGEAKNGRRPDIVIINTCAVTHTSAVKSRKLIKKCRRLYPVAIIVVMGCYSQYEYDYIADRLEADIVIGTSNRDKIVDYIFDFIKNEKQIVKHDSPFDIKKYENIQVTKYLDKTRAYVKIQDGCNNFCTYCLIPYVRGKSRSRNKEDILKEIHELIKNGYKEIILTGIDIGSYGKDLSPTDTFSSLLKDILESEPTLYRLRVSSIEESQIDDLFLELLAKYKNIASHLHIPLQSGSPLILKRMNRKYDLEGFKKAIVNLRKIRPDIAITTDVIVGFPGETQQEFWDTFNFVKDVGFSKVHVFPYSDREGTVASRIVDKVDEKDKKMRVLALLTLSDNLQKEYESYFYEEEIEFLFESYDEKAKAYRGHSSNYLEILYKTDKNIKDEIIPVKFTKENSALNFDIVKKTILNNDDNSI
ncbi:MAG: tRNA (N(6)-L-threonylcarbamoyladenosine(37)-C(2))-methylthiotransferase MtaB [Candidatus Onthovivens sp.]|nr:tRNA (N(6)-L-threonylcarbamoyladenosine(37)-C(2))-methylthiotransferase MtaB [Candidatus Onthovivens sp.]